MSKDVMIRDSDSFAHVDERSHGLVITDSVHHMIHKGLMYQSDRLVPALANDAAIEILIIVAANTSAHMRFQAAIGGDAEVKLFENTTVTGNGTQIVGVNRNRFMASRAATTLTYHTPAVSDDGDPLSPGVSIPGGGGGTPGVGGQVGSFEEWILNPGNYLMQLTNTSGGSQPASVALDWYEPS